MAHGATWRGSLRDAVSGPVAGATVEAALGTEVRTVRTGADGGFLFPDLSAGEYAIAVRAAGKTMRAALPLVLCDGDASVAELVIDADGALLLRPEGGAEASGGEQLSSRQVSGIPLNKRDFSQLLLLAAGTMTDANGAANFTQQFAVNGQRGVTTVFAMDSIDSTDPELGGATFSNFNVDAIEEIKADSGVMPASVGQGAAQFTNIITKSGTNRLHGSVFEFFRNAALDARNFFDRRSIANPGRIPPFVRNEFGFTSGGPVWIPGVYDGRNKTWYFGQYQGFRQVLGTTQVLPVPTAEERHGLNTTAFPGDVLYVPVDPRIQPILERYPLPNDPQGPFGARTLATSSKVRTMTDQFSTRIDHVLSERGRLFGRFNFNNVDGPLTNPSQTAIDPSFAVPFFDHQRSAGISYTRATPRFVWETSIGYIRSTPNFPTINRTQPGIKFSDGLYEGFNTASGSILGSFGNLYQVRQNFTWNRGAHTIKAGVELRRNHDSTVFGTEPNGSYTFGGGAAYSPVYVRSGSGQHDIAPGDLLPDSLTGFLTATPFSYSITAAPPLFAQGERTGLAAARRDAYNFYVQDSWQVSGTLSVNYGLRYEINTRIREAHHLTSGLTGRGLEFVIDPSPPYQFDWNGLGPRLAVSWRIRERTVFRAGGSITTILPNLWQDNFLTGGTPYSVRSYVTATSGLAVPFQNSVLTLRFPRIYSTDGSDIYASGRSTDVPPNTPMDVLRFERELAASLPGHQVRPITGFHMARNFQNGYFGTWTAGIEQSVRDVKLSASYVATAGVKLVRLDYPNGYPGADPEHAPLTIFLADGTRMGFGPTYFLNNGSHSTYHALQTGISKNSLKAGLGFQASYTYSRSMDDTSAVLGGFLSGSSGTLLQTSSQNPANNRAEKAPSTFDVTHVFALSALQELPLERVGFLRRLGRAVSGWQVLNVTALTTGSPFTVYSGIQQTGWGANNADRPDQVGAPELSTSRTVREDYFGRGDQNGSFFSIPVNVPGGTGPNRGRFGTLGRNTFRGPAFRNVDFALIKDTPLGRSDSAARVQFRVEFFNAFNLVNFGLPSNIVHGPGFGVINRTAGTSRQIQFSLKILY